jgi:hypothetical protein
MARDTFNKKTGSSLILARWQISFLALLLTRHYNILYGTRDTGIAHAHILAALLMQ